MIVSCLLQAEWHLMDHSLPTTNCDQFFAELALWLGVNATDLPLILPNIGNFYSPGSASPLLGFMK